jgi:hypothetical protein
MKLGKPEALALSAYIRRKSLISASVRAFAIIAWIYL